MSVASRLARIPELLCRVFLPPANDVPCCRDGQNHPDRQRPLSVFDSGLRSDWKKLIDDFPERFIVGIDDTQNWEEYEAVARNIRFGLLANLRRDVAEKVSYRNAQAWFGLE